MSLLRLLYRPRNTYRKNVCYDLVVPLDYGMLEDRALPNAEKMVLSMATHVILGEAAKTVVWASPEGYGAPASVLDREKILVLKRCGLFNMHICLPASRCTNTITEAEAIVKDHPEASKILLICDWRHARRAQLIWRHFFKGELAIISVDGRWSERHLSPWCRSNFRFALANIGHHILLKIIGIERLRNVAHVN